MQQLGKPRCNGWIFPKIWIINIDQERNRINNYHSRDWMVVKELLLKPPRPHSLTDVFFLTFKTLVTIEQYHYKIDA